MVLLNSSMEGRTSTTINRSSSPLVDELNGNVLAACVDGHYQWCVIAAVCRIQVHICEKRRKRNNKERKKEKKRNIRKKSEERKKGKKK